MSLGVQVPRRSALGLDWCEDFTRGRLGVRKNGGTIVEAVPNVVNFRGRWIELPGSTAAHIQYPGVSMVGATEFTVGCWFDIVSTGTFQMLISQTDSAAWPANAEFDFYFNNSEQMVIGVNISGTWRTRTTVATDLFGEPHFGVATWSSGSTLKVYVDGELNNVSGAYAGVVNSVGNPLMIGRRVDAVYPVDGLLAEPFIVRREWSADEVRNYYRRSMFH